MQKYLLGFLIYTICLVSGTSVQARITQSIDRQEISAGETFVLDIQIDKDVDVQPDLSLLPADFTIVSSSQYQHTQIINGNHSTTKGWKIKLKTLKTGKIVIPAITVGNEATRPITLNIRDASDQLNLNGQNKAIYLEAKVDTASAYVQEQVIYTISLYRAVQTHYASLTEPVAENSIIEKLGDDVQFEKNIGNKRYIVTQRKYAIFPQQSGPLKISPVTFTADVNDSNRRRSLFLNSTRPVSISTKEISLSVKPKPAGANDPWLPAKNVVLADRWTPVTKELTVGEPITWTLMLSVQGLSESQLPEIKLPDIKGLQLYPDTPQKERKIDEKGILGQRIEKYAVIPSVEGPITIPEVRLSWWNTETDKMETAILPSKTFNVRPGKVVSSTPQIIPQIPESKLEVAQSSPQELRNWQIATGAVSFLWILTLIAYFLKNGGAPSSNIVAKNAASTPSEQSKQLLKQAKTAVNNRDLKSLESSLIKLAQLHGNRQVKSIGAIKPLLTEQKLINHINALESALYSSEKDRNLVNMNSSDLDEILKQIFSKRKNEASTGIPPLYAR